jgi:hypothetical protein
MASGKLKKGDRATIRIDMTRTPCDGCARTHIPTAISRLNASPLEDINIVLSINAAALTFGPVGTAGLEVLLSPENRDKVEVKAMDIWSAIFKKLREFTDQRGSARRLAKLCTLKHAFNPSPSSRTGVSTTIFMFQP